LWCGFVPAYICAPAVCSCEDNKIVLVLLELQEITHKHVPHIMQLQGELQYNKNNNQGVTSTCCILFACKTYVNRPQ